MKGQHAAQIVELEAVHIVDPLDPFIYVRPFHVQPIRSGRCVSSPHSGERAHLPVAKPDLPCTFQPFVKGVIDKGVGLPVHDLRTSPRLFSRVASD
eukprot:2864394-Rhodomonas_salina.1